jgi:hypothetical protein
VVAGVKEAVRRHYLVSLLFAFLFAQLHDESRDRLGDLVLLERVGPLDGGEHRRLAPSVREKKLGCSNPVGVTDRLAVQPLTRRDCKQSLREQER